MGCIPGCLGWRSDRLRRCVLRSYGYGGVGFHLRALVREDAPLAFEGEIEGAELEVAGLVSAVDLVDEQVGVLVAELLHPGRQEDGGAVRGRRLGLHPAD